MTYTDLTVGCLFMLEGVPYIVVSSEFHRMQMRKAIMRTSIRNLLTGQLVQKTFTASDRFDPAPIDEINVNYLYHDEDHYHFMEKETYEQYQVHKDILGKKAQYLTTETDVKMMLFDGKPIQITIPKNVNLKVIESPLAVKGDSVSNTFKTVTCENGIKVSCPLFIKEGDVIKVNTETDEYQERVRV
ncbi:MAG: elongation factor P [Candidatus Aureabacteria bacterium]|nr:elongation factor P [Candidatus Auribacterota bacterium]